MTDELKPCPFCGDKKPMLWNDDDTHWNIICADCGATTDVMIAETEAVDAWNRRAPAGGWISVADKVPETDQRVLVYLPGKRPGWRVLLASYEGDGQWYDPHLMLFTAVTYWRPLPPPPDDQ